MKSTVAKALIIAAAGSALGGCASYRSERPKLVYFIVPCSTPGAFAAQPVNAGDDNAFAAPQDLLPDTAKPAAAAPKKAPICLIAAAAGRPYGPAYSGHAYSPYYPYPRHYGGGIGVVLHGGGHRSGHHDAGHRRH